MIKAGRFPPGTRTEPAISISPDYQPQADAKAPSLHRRILEDVEGRILSGEWPPGYRIPFEHELSEQYQCSRMTANKAITELVKRGLIKRRRKSGSHATHPHAQSAVLEIHDIRLEVESLGLSYSYEKLLSTQRKAKDAEPPHGPFRIGTGH